jgi:excisionase family DNA binding protein
MVSVPELMTYEDVAEYCNVSVSAVRKWCHTRQLKSISLGHKIKRISAEELENFLKRRTNR